jgi:hypothetical protein
MDEMSAENRGMVHISNYRGTENVLVQKFSNSAGFSRSQKSKVFVTSMLIKAGSTQPHEYN